MSSKKRPEQWFKKVAKGFCQYEDACRNKHAYKICNDTNCNEKQCDKRHPHPSKIGYKFRFKKEKEVCLFTQLTIACDDNKVTALNTHLLFG